MTKKLLRRDLRTALGLLKDRWNLALVLYPPCWYGCITMEKDLGKPNQLNREDNLRHTHNVLVRDRGHIVFYRWGEPTHPKEKPIRFTPRGSIKFNGH